MDNSSTGRAIEPDSTEVVSTFNQTLYPVVTKKGLIFFIATFIRVLNLQVRYPENCVPILSYDKNQLPFDDAVLEVEILSDSKKTLFLLELFDKLNTNKYLTDITLLIFTMDARTEKNLHEIIKDNGIMCERLSRRPEQEFTRAEHYYMGFTFGVLVCIFASQFQITHCNLNSVESIIVFDEDISRSFVKSLYKLNKHLLGHYPSVLNLYTIDKAGHDEYEFRLHTDEQVSEWLLIPDTRNYQFIPSSQSTTKD